MATIPDEALPCMQGVMPSTIGTCSGEGEPNISVVSQVHFVDDNHVALSFQFFNKTARNIAANPHAALNMWHPLTFDTWRIDATFVRAETDGDIFDEMEMQLEAIASAHGLEDVFHLKAAHIYEVHRIWCTATFDGPKVAAGDG